MPLASPWTPDAAVLLTVPGVQLHKVELGRQELLCEGQLVLQLLSPAEGGAPIVQAKVDDITWLLCKDLPALQAARNVYSFGLPGARQTYFCLILPEDAPDTVLEAVMDVVQATSAFSTIETVEAAKQEVEHKLQQEQQQQQEAPAPPAVPITPSGLQAVPAAAPPQQQAPAHRHSRADRVAANLIAGSAVLAATIARAAVSATGAIRGYAEHRTKSTQPAAMPVKVSPHAMTGIKVAGFLASSAARVTGGAAALVGRGADALAHRVSRTLAGSPRHGGTHDAAGVTPEQRGALKTVGAAALLSFVEVYDALEGAALAVVEESGQGVQQYLGHRYGPDVALAAQSSVPVARNMVKTGLNVQRLGPRALVSRTAKRAAKMTLKNSLAGLHPDEQAAGHKVPPHLATLRSSSAPLPLPAPGTTAVIAPAAGAAAGASMGAYPAVPPATGANPTAAGAYAYPTTAGAYSAAPTGSAYPMPPTAASGALPGVQLAS